MRKVKVIKDWKRQLKSYSFLSLLGSALTAISISSLAVLGVLSSELAFPLLASLAITFGVVGAVGRFLDQSSDVIEGQGEDDVK